ncbi:MAG TPA: hypothetical protein VGZ25_14770 [Gemmataceae bacterium]|nr:hypothetical protein [Gemmataceae bacterium]
MRDPSLRTGGTGNPLEIPFSVLAEDWESEAVMRRTWLRAVGTGFVGTALMMGCQHSRHCESCSHGTTVVPPTSVTPIVPAQKMPSSSTYHMQEHDPVVVNPMPITEPVETVKMPEPPAVDPVKTEEIEQAAFAREVADAKKMLKARRSFHDITADPCFDHAADYSSVTGELYFEKDSKTWTVRYLSVDEDDRYGGKVTLADGSMENLKSGQMVRVEGQMADPESHQACPTYKVQSIKAVRD